MQRRSPIPYSNYYPPGVQQAVSSYPTPSQPTLTSTVKNNIHQIVNPYELRPPPAYTTYMPTPKHQVILHKNKSPLPPHEYSRAPPTMLSNQGHFSSEIEGSIQAIKAKKQKLDQDLAQRLRHYQESNYQQMPVSPTVPRANKHTNSMFDRIEIKNIAKPMSHQQHYPIHQTQAFEFKPMVAHQPPQQNKNSLNVDFHPSRSPVSPCMPKQSHSPLHPSQPRPQLSPNKFNLPRSPNQQNLLAKSPISYHKAVPHYPFQSPHHLQSPQTQYRPYPSHSPQYRPQVSPSNPASRNIFNNTQQTHFIFESNEKQPMKKQNDFHQIQTPQSPRPIFNGAHKKEEFAKTIQKSEDRISQLKKQQEVYQQQYQAQQERMAEQKRQQRQEEEWRKQQEQLERQHQQLLLQSQQHQQVFMAQQNTLQRQTPLQQLHQVPSKEISQKGVSEHMFLSQTNSNKAFNTIDFPDLSNSGCSGNVLRSQGDMQAQNDFKTDIHIGEQPAPQEKQSNLYQEQPFTMEDYQNGMKVSQNIEQPVQMVISPVCSSPLLPQKQQSQQESQQIQKNSVSYLSNLYGRAKGKSVQQHSEQVGTMKRHSTSYLSSLYSKAKSQEKYNQQATIQSVTRKSTSYLANLYNKKKVEQQQRKQKIEEQEQERKKGEQIQLQRKSTSYLSSLYGKANREREQEQEREQKREQEREQKREQEREQQRVSRQMEEQVQQLQRKSTDYLDRLYQQIKVEQSRAEHMAAFEVQRQENEKQQRLMQFAQRHVTSLKRMSVERVSLKQTLDVTDINFEKYLDIHSESDYSQGELLDEQIQDVVHHYVKGLKSRASLLL